MSKMFLNWIERKPSLSTLWASLLLWTAIGAGIYIAFN